MGYGWSGARVARLLGASSEERADMANASIEAIELRNGGSVDRIYGNCAGWTAVCVDCGGEYDEGYRWSGNGAFNHKICFENAAGIDIEAMRK